MMVFSCSEDEPSPAASFGEGLSSSYVVRVLPNLGGASLFSAMSARSFFYCLLYLSPVSCSQVFIYVCVYEL